MGPAIIESLRTRIAAGRVVIFVGSGVSCGAAATPLACWKGMLEAGIRACEARRDRLPPAWAAQQRRTLAQGDLEAWLHVAEEISRQLGAPRGDEFRRWLRETVGALEPRQPGVLEAIGTLNVPLVTTNYDGLIERVTGRRPVTWRQDHLVTRFAQERPLDDVLHIHGHWEDAESIVLGIRSYERLTGHGHVQRTLRALLLTHTALFIGYGDGMEDPDLGPLRAWISSFVGAEHRHYRLCRRCETPEIAEAHEGERIDPLVYGESHDDLEPFLRALAPRGRAPAASA